MACHSPSCCGLYRLGFGGLDGVQRATTLSIYSSPPPLRHLVVRQLQFPRCSSIFTTFVRRKKLVQKQHVEGEEEGGVDEDAFEALFAQLEEDLKNDEISINESDDDEITEEDLANLEKELEEAFGDVDLGELSVSDIPLSENMDSDDDEPEEIRPKLKNWQLRRLASALKIGRRKTNIKSLSAELGLDRSFVLEMLRNPPSDLLLLSASLPDTVLKQPAEIENKFIEEEVPSPIVEPIAKPNSETKAPIHLTQSRWLTEKKLKKVQVQILEKVYNRTKRPTDAMVSSIVYVTHLPRKRIVKWFEDKRIEDGIPVKRQAFQRTT